MSKLRKTYPWLGAGLGLLLVYWISAFFGLTNAREVYLVPTSYRGVVYILFDQRTGVPPEREGFKRLYRIPRSGILRTQFSAQYGRNGLPEFLWDSSGHRRPLPHRFWTKRRLPPHGAYASTLEFGTGGCKIEGRKNSTRSTHYQSFIVCEDRDLARYYDELREHIHTPSELSCNVLLLGDNDSVRISSE